MTNFDPYISLFWLFSFLVFWPYIGYFIVLYLAAAVRSRPVQTEDHTPPVTLVITAFNEERRIWQKIENSLGLDYPAESLRIIVVSDGSTDETDDIVGRFEDRGVKLLHIQERKGKHYSQGQGVKMAETDIVILSDATTFLKEDAIRKIVRSFIDPKVGVVSGEDKIKGDNNDVSAEGVYVRYEMKLRSLEARTGSLVGASGCFFAIRKHLAAGWVDDMSSDFFMPILAAMNGYRTVPDTEAIGYYDVNRSADREFQRKVRTVLHGLEVLFKFSSIMNPFKYGWFSVQLISHKLLRWLVPFSLAGLLICNAVLTEVNMFYRTTFALQLLFYAAAALGAVARTLKHHKLLKIPLFFVMVNLAIIIAWYQFVRGYRQVTWTVTKR